MGNGVAVVVLGGVDVKTGNEELLVLDDRGAILSQEGIDDTDHAVAVAYDGVRDRWFIFEAPTFPIADRKPGRLRIREWRDRAWSPDEVVHELDAVPRRSREVVVMNDVVAFVTFDTEDELEVAAFSTEGTSFEPLGSSPINAAAYQSIVGGPVEPSGGLIAVVGFEVVTKGNCKLVGQRAQVDLVNGIDAVAFDSGIENIPCEGSVGLAMDPETEGRGRLVVPQITGGGRIVTFDLTNPELVNGDGTAVASILVDDITGTAVAPCRNATLAAGNGMRNVGYAIAVFDGARDPAPLPVPFGPTVHNIEFEPSSERLLVMHSDGGTRLLHAYSIEEDQPQTLERDIAWPTLAYFKIESVAVRQPYPQVCP
jgi:hypothetical protein